MRRDVSAVLFGVLVTTILSGSLVIAGLKAGISPGVSPLVVLVAWGVFSRRVAGQSGTRFLTIAQVAGSAGMAVTVGVIFTAPVVQILYTDRGIEAARERGIALPEKADGSPDVGRPLLATLAEHGLRVPDVEPGTLMLLSMAGALVGFGFVGLGTRKFLTDPTLPAPEARACHTLIRAAASDPGNRPRLGRSLHAGLLAGFAAPALVRLGLASHYVALLTRSRGDRRFSLDLPFVPIYVGIGGLLTLTTALSVFGGTMLRLGGDFMLAGLEAGSDAARRYPANSMRWVGGGAMSVAVAWSLVRFLRAGAGGAGEEPDELVRVDPARRRWQGLAIVVGATTIVAWLAAVEGFTAFTFAMSAAILGCAALMVVLGALLSLQIGSSASPVSGTIFVSTLVLCLVALFVGRRSPEDVLLLTPLLVAACVAVCAANDSSQDYKTAQLCGLRVQDVFLAQFVGLIAGALVVPIVVAVAHRAFVLGSTQLSAPQGKMFSTLIDGLLLRNELPWWPIVIGLAIGLAAVGLEALGRRRGLHLPAMALAVGIYLPAHLGVGILIGALCRRAGEKRGTQRHESILASAGLITGAAAFELLLGIAIVGISGFDPAALGRFAAGGPLDVGGTARTVVALVGLATLGSILWANSRPPRASDAGP